MKIKKLLACIVCGTPLLSSTPINAMECDLDENVTETLSEFTDLVKTDSPSSTRLIVKTEDFINTETALSVTRYDDTYILDYIDEEACNQAFDLYTSQNISVSKDFVLETAGISDVQDTITFHNSEGTTPVKVAIIDTGYSGDNSRVISDGTDENGHGTQMSDIILNNTPNCVTIESIKALGDNGQGSIIDVYIGIKKAIEDNANIINLSLTTSVTENSTVLTDIINEATNQGITVVVASGNYGQSTEPFTPANIDSAIVVGATDEYGTRQSFSNYGSTIDYMAYGVSGTSESCAIVASMIANLKSCGENADVLLDYVNDKGDAGWDEYYGNGVLSYTNFLFKNNTDENVDIITPPGGSLTNDIVVTQTAYALHLYFGFYNNPWNNSAGEGVHWMTTYTEEMNVANSFTMPPQFSWMLNGFYDGWTGSHNTMYYNAAGQGTRIVHAGASGNIVANWNTSLITKFFDAGQYGALNPDVNSAMSGNAFYLWNHYLLHGINEGRPTSYIFNPKEYKALYGDLWNAYGNDWWRYAAHFAQFGYSEGRWGTYNVTTFNANGGSCSTSTMNTSYNKPLGTTAANHTAANILPVPTRSGYIFTGWYTSPSGGTLMQWNTTCPYYTDFTVYAHWSVNSYTVTCYDYLTDGSTYLGRAGDTTRTYGSSITGSAWGTTSTYNNTQHTYSYDHCSSAIVNGNITVYRYWRRNTNSYTITYNGNGGTPNKGSQSAPYGSSWGILATATRTGYVFDGWYTAASGGTNIVASTICSGNITVYAHWEQAIFNISYNLDEGFITGEPKTYTSGIETKIPNPEKTGYIFKGWTGSNGSTPQVDLVIDSTSTGDMLYTANWELKPITIRVPNTVVMDKDGNCSMTVSSDISVGKIYLSTSELSMNQKNKTEAKVSITTSTDILTSDMQSSVITLQTEQLTAGPWQGQFSIGLVFSG